MNIIEAWKKAKEGQKIRRTKWDTNQGIYKKDYLNSTNITEAIYDIDLFADDWEIVKEHKVWKTIIVKGEYQNNVGEETWEKWNNIPIGTKVRVAWEWEE